MDVSAQQKNDKTILLWLALRKNIYGFCYMMTSALHVDCFGQLKF
jgi:hypothetical protein